MIERREVPLWVPILAIIGTVLLIFLAISADKPDKLCYSTYSHKELVTVMHGLQKTSYPLDEKHFEAQQTAIHAHNRELQYYDKGQVEFATDPEEPMVITPAVGDHANSKYPPAKSGKVISKFTINCGDIVEIEATLPTKDGAWGALWTLPTDSVKEDEAFFEHGGENLVWPTGGELDIIEASSSQKAFSSAIHYRYESLFPSHCLNLNQDRDCYVTRKPNVPFETKKHRFYLYRECNRVTMWIDNHEPHLSQCQSYMVPKEKYKHHLIMNLAIGGDLGEHIAINKKALRGMEMTIHSVNMYRETVGKPNYLFLALIPGGIVLLVLLSYMLYKQ
eukprot:Nk52_evm27s1129 gene=Nk52_evmTU27s1129